MKALNDRRRMLAWFVAECDRALADIARLRDLARERLITLPAVEHSRQPVDG